MVKIEILIEENKISKINELELDRYINFFSNSYKDNLEHAIFVKNSFPRWSIISSYYAMHDISKLLFSKIFQFKVDLEVHSTTIKLLRELIKNKETAKLLESGYREFILMANDLAEAKNERVKTQYYTGTEFMKKDYQKKSEEFLKNIVLPFIEKMKKIINEK